jgi:anthranilate synthase component 2/para-aminobenzoate synthetase
VDAVNPMSIPDVVIVDHYDSFTWNLAHLVASVTGSLPEIRQHDQVRVDEVLTHGYVILSPGPGHPRNARDFAVGRAVVRSGAVPVLGVCLGMQGMVTGFGGHVVRSEPVHGEVAAITHDGRGVFHGLPQRLQAVRYHSLAASDVGPDLVVTALAADGTIMGVRHPSLPLEGVQFHPESVLSEHGRAMMVNFLGQEDRA